MAWEQRRPIFDLQGSLNATIAPGDNQLSCTALSSIPTDYTTGLYLPLVLSDGAKSEVVWVTGHSSGSPTVQVARGREGTTAQSFDGGTTVVRCSPTLRDVVSRVANRAALPSDPHRGMRVLLGDEGLVVERGVASWSESAGVQDNSNRRHSWQQASGGFLDPGAVYLATGMTPILAGNVASYAGGKLRLNQSGLWVIEFSVYTNHNQAGWMNIGLSWPSSPAPAGSLYDRRHRSYTADGQLNNRVTFMGWVTDSQAAQDISLECSQVNAGNSRITTFQPQVRAELIAR